MRVLYSLGYKYSFWHNVDKLTDANDRAAEILQEIGMTERASVPAGLCASVRCRLQSAFFAATSRPAMRQRSASSHRSPDRLAEDHDRK